MGLITGPEPGQTITLDVTQEAQHRILAGLSWDPRDLSKKELVQQALSGIRDITGSIGDIQLFRTNVSRIMEKTDTPEREESDRNFDLDLLCFAYDSNGGFQCLVDPDAWNAIDESGKVYHSGDEMLGTGGPDDEQIHIELKNIPDNLKSFVFVVQSDCAFTFDDVINPKIRLADSYSNNNFLEVELDKLANNQSHAYVFCSITHQGNEWQLKNISEFTNFEQNWQEYLKSYVD